MEYRLITKIAAPPKLAQRTSGVLSPAAAACSLSFGDSGHHGELAMCLCRCLVRRRFRPHPHPFGKYLPASWTFPSWPKPATPAAYPGAGGWGNRRIVCFWSASHGPLELLLSACSTTYAGATIAMTWRQLASCATGTCRCSGLEHVHVRRWWYMHAHDLRSYVQILPLPIIGQLRRVCLRGLKHPTLKCLLRVLNII
jgi:hypothetical protein